MAISARAFTYAAIIGITFSVAGCSSPDRGDTNVPQDELYREARRQLDSGRFDLAVEILEQLETAYPFGAYAEQSQLENIYAFYRLSRYEEAVETGEHFILLHPRHPQLDYVLYLQGLSLGLVRRGLVRRYLPITLSARDLSGPRQAFAKFSTLLEKYPGSLYAADAKAHMLYLRNLLAHHEVVVANHHLRYGSWLAAANRGRYVVEHFPGAPAMPDALAIMVHAWEQEGLEELAEDALEVLVLNYPDHPSLDEEGNFLGPEQSQPGNMLERVYRLGANIFTDPPPHFDTSGP